jgi:hypothetical protein
MRLVRPAALLGLTSALIACGHPTAGALIKRLADNRQALESIVRMAKVDKHLVRVASDFTWLADDVSWPRKDIGLTPDRWERYRDLFREPAFLRATSAWVRIESSCWPPPKDSLPGVARRGVRFPKVGTPRA